MTEWRDVVGMDGKYSVSDSGLIRSNIRWKILKLTLNPYGYLQVCVKPDGRKGKSKVIRVHRAVAIAFLENTEGKPTVNHIDGVKTNNCIENLEWATHSEQIQHAVDNGLKIVPVGEGVHCSKLTENQVNEIASRVGYRVRDIAKEFGVCHTTISRIRTGKRWGFITGLGL